MNQYQLADYLDHMGRAAADAVEFVSGMDKASFLADRRTQNAVVMSLIVLGEAATKVMDLHAEFAQQHAAVPWRQMRGMRNRIAHGYFETDFELVWDTVALALPALAAALAEARTQIDPPIPPISNLP